MENLTIPIIQQADLKGKVVLVRVDHNVVKNGIIHDPYRIDATIGTLFHIISKGGKIILMTHVGRPKDKKTGEINISDKTSIQPIVDYLQQKLHITLKVPEFLRTRKTRLFRCRNLSKPFDTRVERRFNRWYLYAEYTMVFGRRSQRRRGR